MRLSLRNIFLILLIPPAWANTLSSVPAFFNLNSKPVILAPCQPAKPWTVAGESGALLGRQSGKFESWQWPVKLLSNFSIEAELSDYPVPIDVNSLAATIRVTPAETTITYSHAAFTIRQHMFAPRGSGATPFGAVVLFEIQSIRPLRLTFSFTPEMLRMWPAPNFGRPNGAWVVDGDSGYYLLDTDNPSFSGVIAMPHTQPGTLVPYQEHPQTYPLELKLSFDPKRDNGQVFPLFMAVRNSGPATSQLQGIAEALEKQYSRTIDYYESFLATHLSVETPDPRVNEALSWAEVSIDQMQVKYGGEVGLVAGYYESADSSRPGYAWFFGRDTMWTTYAINSYGDFAATRNALDFLIRKQRSDGKIMHEFSQSASLVNWQATPYFYAAADSAPLLVMTMWDYVKTSNDLTYLRTNWSAVKKAYNFCRAHEGDDGIYNNAEGTGWVESWPQGMPKEEIYLAALDQQASDAIARLATLMNDAALSQSAKAKAADIGSKLETEFYEPDKQFYAFSRNGAGTLDQTASIYPAVAWWDGTLALQKAGPMFSRWASAEFSADWGTRDLSDRTPFYDPISYHQGSIWPLFTGWVSLAEYRTGHDLSGYAHLMQNLNLTWTQDLGSVTELLSGQFFQPLGRSSSHQMWSSAMVLAPLVRGLFGLDWDVPNHKLCVAPSLPAEWSGAQLRKVPFGTTTVDLDFARKGEEIVVHGKAADGSALCLIDNSTSQQECHPSNAPVVEIAAHPVEISIPATLPEPGATTSQLKVTGEVYSSHQAVFDLEGQGGSSYNLFLRSSGRRLTVDGAALLKGALHVEFPPGPGYQNKKVTIHW